MTARPEIHSQELISADEWNWIVTSASRILAATVYLASFSSLILSLGYANELSPSGLLIRVIGLQFSLISVGNLLVRLPKSVKQKDSIKDADLDELAQELQVVLPRVVVDGPANRVQVLIRGRSVRGEDRQTLLVSRLGAYLWGQNRTTKRAHLAHELAHLKSADARQYARVGASLIITSVLLSISMWRAVLVQPILVAFIGATILVMVIAWLNYTRFREFAADAIGATAARSELVSSLRAGLTSDSPSISQRLTHPSPKARLAHLDNPSRIFSSLGMGFFMLGLVSIYFSLALGLTLVTFIGERESLTVIASTVTAVLLALVCAPTFNAWNSLARFEGSPGRWLRNLIIGEFTALTIIADAGRMPGLLSSAIIAIVIAAWVTCMRVIRRVIPGLSGTGGIAVIWLFTSLAWARGYLIQAAMVLLRLYQQVR